MRIFGIDISLAKKSISIDTLIERLSVIYETHAGVSVTPETAMSSPTVRSIVSRISNAVSTLPLRVYQKTQEGRRVRRTEIPDHPLVMVLNRPNGLQDRATFWLDGVSWLLRYGNMFAVKGQGRTGPVRELTPVLPSDMKVELNEFGNIVYTNSVNGSVFDAQDVLHLRLSARNGYLGDSPVSDVREAIGLEIAAERMGASVFGNSAMPSLLFSYMEGFSESFESAEEEKKFIDDFNNVYSKRGRFRSMFVPYGIKADTISVDMEKSQFVSTRQHQRTVIAGAFGVPPHMVGDMSASSFNNVEQQSLNFIVHVVKPITTLIEAGLERSFLTPQEVQEGVVIRFDLDVLTRVDFKARQEGLKIRREMGIINPNDWREADGENPISVEDGGEQYWTKGPSGQGTSEAPPAEPTTEG